MERSLRSGNHDIVLLNLSDDANDSVDEKNAGFASSSVTYMPSNDAGSKYAYAGFLKPKRSGHTLGHGLFIGYQNLHGLVFGRLREGR